MAPSHQSPVTELPGEPRWKEELVARVVMSIKEGIVVQTNDGVIVWANPQSEVILGLTLEQMRGRTSLDPEWRCVHEDGTDFPGSEHPAMLALRTGEAQHDVVMGVHKPRAGLSWILASSNPLPQRGGVVTSFVDITERVQREHELEETSARERAVLDGASVAIIGTHLDGIIHTYNAAAERMLGWTAEEMLGKRTPSLIHDPAEVAARARELRIEPGFEVFVHRARAGAAETRAWSYVRKDGSTLPVSLTVSAIRDTEGKLVGFMGIAEDVSELRQSEARLRVFVESLPDTVFRVCQGGIFRDVHTPDPTLLMLPKEQFLGQHLSAVLPPHLAHEFVSAIEFVLRRDVPRTLEYELEVPSGVRDFEARVVPAGGHEVLVIVRDVSERKRLDRMQDEFVSSVSHELRTPLTAIHGTLGLLAGRVLGPLSREAEELVSVARANSERLSRLIDDILDLENAARGGLKLDCSPQQLGPVLERAVREMAPYAREFGVRYELAHWDPAARANIDADRLLQVLSNLLSNAAKYGDEGAAASIALHAEPLGWRVTVENRGVPIPDGFRSRIFQRFAMIDGSSRRSRRGTGLGLAITRALLEKMGGHIDYKSDESKTVFFFTLPAA